MIYYLFIPLAPIFLLTFYWSINSIANQKNKKAIPIAISTIIFFVFVYSAVLASTY